jgi:hypothetical protein
MPPTTAARVAIVAEEATGTAAEDTDVEAMDAGATGVVEATNRV